MRRRGVVLLGTGLAAALVVASVATPQDGGSGQPHYWPHRTFFIPVSLDRINQADPKPTSLQLYSAVNRGTWQSGAKLPVTGLENLDDGRKGFQFTADRDGEYEFSVQYWYADGSSTPKKVDELAPMLSVVIDTTPPVVQITATSTGVRWVATDDHLDPRGVSLQCKWPYQTKWQTVTGTFKPSDTYAWRMQPGQVLEVRVSARDRAGHEGYSPVVRVPGDAAVGAAFPKSPAGSPPDWLPGSGTRDPLTGGGRPPDPRVTYVNGMDVTVEYTIQRIGRSGIKSARLYVLPYKDPAGWKPAGDFPVSLQPGDKDQTLSLKYTAKEDGVYGFYVAPESGAGVKADPPRKDDPPMMSVVVDTKDPYVKITGVRVSQGVRGPVVELTWEAYDQNLMADPISLEYSVDKDAIQWKEIKYRLPPGTIRPDGVGQNRYVGQYTWEVPDENVWKFYVRIRAVDMAGNTGKNVWGQSETNPTPTEVIVDLEKPAAGITGVRGGNGPAAQPAPVTPSQSPATQPNLVTPPKPLTPPPPPPQPLIPSAPSAPSNRVKLPDLPGSP